MINKRYLRRTHYTIGNYPHDVLKHRPGDHLVVNGRLCKLEAITEKAICLRRYGRRAWFPIAWVEIDHARRSGKLGERENCFCIDRDDMSAEKTAVVGCYNLSVAWLDYFYSNLSDGDTMRVYLDNGMVVAGVPPITVKMICEKEGAAVDRYDAVSIEWLDNGDYTSYGVLL